MQFTKLHGLGNDYIYIDGIAQDLAPYDLPELSRVLSDRNFGIGGDGIILVLASDVADFQMRIFNSDGSEAEMCGNGVRAFAKYVFEHGLTDKAELTVETGAGIIKPVLTVEDGTVTMVRADMGKPRLNRADIPMAGEPAGEPVVSQPLIVDDREFFITCVSMGNPHCVIFVDEITDELVKGFGPKIETHEAFPKKTNVEFAKVEDRGTIRMRVWERGAGETLACGTGASATAVAAALNGLCDREAWVCLLGGDLHIEWAEDDHIFLTGPAAETFSGEVHPDLLARARD